MARPLVLGRTDHPTIWTPVYADVTDPKMTDWLWEQRESEEQKERFLRLHKRRKLLNSEERDRRFVKKQRKSHDQSGDLQEYRLMTSVSIPVFDRRENAVRFHIFFTRLLQVVEIEKKTVSFGNVVGRQCSISSSSLILKKKKILKFKSVCLQLYTRKRV